MEFTDAVARRLEFLLSEAKHEATRDQVITYAMRVISNYASIGKDAASSEIKLRNRTVSSKARDLLLSGVSVAEWTSRTINEHPVPLKETWLWMIGNAKSLTIGEVWHHFVQNKMVTLLLAEDHALTSMGLRSTSGGSSRYRKAGIEICTLTDDPRTLLTK